jgi:hypothetical protein
MTPQERKSVREAMAANNLLRLEMAALKDQDASAWANAAMWKSYYKARNGPVIQGVYETGA